MLKCLLASMVKDYTVFLTGYRQHRINTCEHKHAYSYLYFFILKITKAIAWLLCYLYLDVGRTLIWLLIYVSDNLTSSRERFCPRLFSWCSL